MSKLKLTPDWIASVSKATSLNHYQVASYANLLWNRALSQQEVEREMISLARKNGKELLLVARDRN